MRSVISLVILSLTSTLISCGGNDHNISSSQTSSQSSIPTYSNFDEFAPDADRGEALYHSAELDCQGCHDREQVSVANSENAHSIHFLIELSMPEHEPELCTGQCAADIAEYLVQRYQGYVETACGDQKRAPIVGHRTLRLLSSEEYENALEDVGLVSPEEDYSQYAPIDNTTPYNAFPNNTNQILNETLLQFYHAQAKSLAESHWQTVAGNCAEQGDCLERVLSIAERLFRRPLSSNLKQQYANLLRDYGEYEGVQTALWSALSSPHFLYVSQLGIPVDEAIEQNWALDENLELEGKQVYVLDNYEMASVLSLMYTGSLPDQPLLEAAKNNQLNTNEQLYAHIDRLLASPRGREHTGRFASDWLNLSNLVIPNPTEMFRKNLTQVQRQSMVEEVRQWFRYVFYNPDIPLDHFFSSDSTLVDDVLADYYQSTITSKSAPFGVAPGWQLASSPNRGGILTSAAFMAHFAYADRTSPVRRAANLRYNLLCQEIPYHPEITQELEERLHIVEAEVLSGYMTNRDYYERFSDAPMCDNCHEKLITPLFGMEDFDELGRYRTTTTGLGPNGVANLSIDDSGELIGTLSQEDNDVHPFHGTRELGAILAKLEGVKACFVEKSFRHLVKAPLSITSYPSLGYWTEIPEGQKAGYACLKESLINNLAKGNGEPKAVFRNIGTLELLRYRQ